MITIIKKILNLEVNRSLQNGIFILWFEADQTRRFNHSQENLILELLNNIDNVQRNLILTTNNELAYI